MIQEKSGNFLDFHAFISAIQSLFFPSILIALPVTRMLVQVLSNLVTSNAPLAQTLWTTYLNLPMENLILMYAPQLVSSENFYSSRAQSQSVFGGA